MTIIIAIVIGVEKITMEIATTEMELQQELMLFQTIMIMEEQVAFQDALEEDKLNIN